MRYEQRQTAGLREPVARYLAVWYEMGLLFDASMADALDAQRDAFGALGRSVSDTDFVLPPINWLGQRRLFLKRRSSNSTQPERLACPSCRLRAPTGRHPARMRRRFT